MPEKPEVITVAKKLESKLIGETIEKVEVFHQNMIEYPKLETFQKEIVSQTIHSITTRGKWIVCELDKDYLLFHLRMEGKFFFRTKDIPKGKHEHIIFSLKSGIQLRFSDVRKFGKVMLIPKNQLYTMKPYTELGLEPWDKKLTVDYLKEQWKNKNTPLKGLLLDQSVIAGIGNIYADEILFLSRLHPLTTPKMLKKHDYESLIENTKKVLDKAISEGGTTIRSYTSEEGVTGLFQNDLNVHAREKENCRICGNKIQKIRVGGRGTYFCPICQKERKISTKV